MTEIYSELTYSFVDTFNSKDDADTWLDGHKQDYPKDEWEIIEERVNLLGGKYRAGIVFQRRQKELFDFDN